MEELLFVGGPADGRWNPVDSTRMTVYIPAPERPARYYTAASDAELYVRYTYSLHVFRGQFRDFRVMVWDKLEGDVVGTLLAGYRKPMEGES